MGDFRVDVQGKVIWTDKVSDIPDSDRSWMNKKSVKNFVQWIGFWSRGLSNTRVQMMCKTCAKCRTKGSKGGCVKWAADNLKCSSRGRLDAGKISNEASIRAGHRGSSLSGRRRLALRSNSPYR